MIDWLKSDWVRELSRIENRFLQCLVTDFVLERRKPGGVQLTLTIDDRSPTIWLRDGRDFVKNAISAARQKSLKEELDAFLVQGDGEYQAFHEEPKQYCLRYCSGGTLPIVRRGDEDYYCLFYRDVFPIGWNIANGGTATREELLSPMLAVERELREELIVVDPSLRRRYVFPSERGKLSEREEFAVSRRHLQQILRAGNAANFNEPPEADIPIAWLDGPDSLSVRLGRSEVTTDNCFVTITSEDFGIEIDRVAKICIPEDATLFDGEVYNGLPLDRPVGLFQVERMHRAIQGGDNEFIPDIFFHGAQEEEPAGFRAFIDVTLVNQIERMNDPQRLREFLACEHKFQLCPVTQRLVARQAKMIPPDLFSRSLDRRRKYDIFVSCGNGDESVAEIVHRYVSDELDTPAYFYRLSARNPLILGEIEDALSTARFLVPVATHPGRLTRSYPDYERKVFMTRMLNSQAPANAGIIPYVGFEPRELPVGYSLFSGIQFDPQDPAAKLAELRKFLISTS